jgi:hypothetical protein
MPLLIKSSIFNAAEIKETIAIFFVLIYLIMVLRFWNTAF